MKSQQQEQVEEKNKNKMSQELLQREKEPLTLAEICPKWAEAFRTGIKPVGFYMSIYDRQTCVVGEAHNWSENYNCDICAEFSHGVDGLAYHSYEKNADTFRERLTSFVAHWNAYHVMK